MSDDVFLSNTQWKRREYMLKIDINEGKDLMNLEYDFKKSSEMLIIQKCRVFEWKLFILKYKN